MNASNIQSNTPSSRLDSFYMLLKQRLKIDFTIWDTICDVCRTDNYSRWIMISYQNIELIVSKRSNLINNLWLIHLNLATCFNLIIPFVYPFCNVVYLGIRFSLHLNPFCNNNASKEYDCKAFSFLPFTFIMWYIMDYIARHGFL